MYYFFMTLSLAAIVCFPAAFGFLAWDLLQGLDAHWFTEWTSIGGALLSGLLVGSVFAAGIDDFASTVCLRSW